MPETTGLGNMIGDPWGIVDQFVRRPRTKTPREMDPSQLFVTTDQIPGVPLEPTTRLLMDLFYGILNPYARRGG